MAVLSILIVAGDLCQRAVNCLDALYRQEGIEDCDIVLVDNAASPAGARYARFPRLRYFHRPDLTLVGDARLEAFRQAACELAAFLEDHVIPQPGWLQAVLTAFALSEKIAIVNYAFINPRPDSYVSRAFTLLEYGHWMAPGRSGPIAYACQHNLAYRKSEFLDAGASDPELLESEFLIHRRLLDAGWTIWYAADAVVAHESWTRVWDGVRANACMKRMLACARARGWGVRRRLLYTVGMAAVPALLLGRLARSVAGRRALWGEFLYTLPLVVFTYTIGSIWEAAGYLFGEGTARNDFAQFEYRAERGR